MIQDSIFSSGAGNVFGAVTTGLSAALGRDIFYCTAAGLSGMTTAESGASKVGISFGSSPRFSGLVELVAVSFESDGSEPTGR
jgi:hypothetical protein